VFSSPAIESIIGNVFDMLLKISKGVQMQDEELAVEGFPGYSVDVYGDVRNGYSRRVLTRSVNQQGVASVALVVERGSAQCRRSIALLVANAFLADSKYDCVYASDTPTPIHLDGDRMNCRVDNLMWRPRWFARQYHKERAVDPFPNWGRPFELLETGEVFAHPRECAVAYGLLEATNHGIYIALANKRHIFPTGQSFWWCD